MPGYSPDVEYNVIILAFILNYGEADAAAIWGNPFGFFEPTKNPWGETKEEVLKKWRSIYNTAGKKILVSAFGST